MIKAGDVRVAGMIGFAAACYLMSLLLVPSLFAATALTATSVGVAVWRNAGALHTGQGGLLTDVAELDDISGVKKYP